MVDSEGVSEGVGEKRTRDVTGRLVISRTWYTLQTLSWSFVIKNRT
jgi:hypothetical protein